MMSEEPNGKHIYHTILHNVTNLKYTTQELEQLEVNFDK